MAGTDSSGGSERLFAHAEGLLLLGGQVGAVQPARGATIRVSDGRQRCRPYASPPAASTPPLLLLASLPLGPRSCRSSAPVEANWASAKEVDGHDRSGAQHVAGLSPWPPPSVPHTALDHVRSTSSDRPRSPQRVAPGPIALHLPCLQLGRLKPPSLIGIVTMQAATAAAAMSRRSAPFASVGERFSSRWCICKTTCIV